MKSKALVIVYKACYSFRLLYFLEKMAYKYQPIKDEIFVSDTEDGEEEEGEELGDGVQEEFEEVKWVL